jgi:hypothetical protein
MSLSSWPILCHCSICKGKKFQSLVYVGPGTWQCPQSGFNFSVDLTKRDRAKRRHAAYIKA